MAQGAEGPLYNSLVMKDTSDEETVAVELAEVQPNSANTSNTLDGSYLNRTERSTSSDVSYQSDNEFPSDRSENLEATLTSPQLDTTCNNNRKDFEAVKQVDLFGVNIVALTINSKERLCLAQISNTLLKEFSYNEIHNRRVALGITCVQCTPIQLEMLRRAGAMPSSSRRCGMITRREAERLCRSFLVEEQPPELPENFYFTVAHRVNYGCKGRFVPARYISSRAKCIECFYCGEYYSPNKFIFHSHRQPHATDCNPPDSPNINSWRKHIDLDWSQEHSQEVRYAWEDVKSLFNGGTRRRAPNPISSASHAEMAMSSKKTTQSSSTREPSVKEKIDEEQLIDVEYDELTSGCKGTDSASGSKPKFDQPRAGKRPIGGGWNTPASKGSSASRQATSLILHPNNPSPARLSSEPSPSAKRYSTGLHSSIAKRFMPNETVVKAPHAVSDFINQSRSPCTSLTNANGLILPGMHQSQSTINDELSGRIRNHPQAPVTQNPNDKPLGLLYPAPDTTSFIYNQLYNQLIAPVRQTNSASVDTQLALRHHLWSNLLANLQCVNPTYGNQQQQLQQQQQSNMVHTQCNTSMNDLDVTANSFNHLSQAHFYSQQSNSTQSIKVQRNDSNTMEDSV